MLSIISTYSLTLLAWGGVGLWEVAIIALVILLLFGGKKLPELARGLAKGLKSFKEEMHGIEQDIDDVKKSITEEPSAGKASETGNKEPETGEEGIRN